MSSLTPFEKCCRVHKYIDNLDEQIIVVKYMEPDLNESVFTATIHNLHLFHLCHDLKISKRIKVFHIFPNSVNYENVKETLVTTHGVQDPENILLHRNQFNEINLTEQFIDFDKVPFNNLNFSPPLLRKKSVMLYNYNTGDDIVKRFSYLYPIIVMRESLFNYNKKYSNNLYEFLREYLQNVKFVGESHNALNKHLFGLFPWNDAYYKWHNHSKVIHYYNLLFMLFQIGGEVNSNIQGKTKRFNIEFTDETKKKAWRSVSKKIDQYAIPFTNNTFNDDHSLFNLDNRTYKHQEHNEYNKELWHDISLKTNNIETNIQSLRQKMLLFLKKLKLLTPDRYNVLYNWNYPLKPTPNDITKVFRSIQQFSMYQVGCIENQYNYKFQFNKTFALDLGNTTLTLDQEYNCMHQYMKPNIAGITTNSNDEKFINAIKQVLKFDKSIQLYDSWMEPLLKEIKEKLGVEKIPEYADSTSSNTFIDLADEDKNFSDDNRNELLEYLLM